MALDAHPVGIAQEGGAVGHRQSGVARAFVVLRQPPVNALQRPAQEGVLNRLTAS